MTESTRVEATFVPRSGEGWRDPFPMYRALRDRDPVHHVVDGDYWVLSRHAHVIAAATDTATFSSAKGLTFVYGDVAAAGLGEISPMVFLDPPEHTEFRRLVARGFTPRQVATIEPDVRTFVRERLAVLLEANGGDVVAELLKPLPTLVVGHYLGVPPADRARFDGWVHRIVAASALGDVLRASDPVAELYEYFSALVERRRSDPGEDVISELVAASDGAGVHPLRILGFAFTMVTGGNDTSTGLLAGGLALLADHPDQRYRLARDPSAIPNAVTELLRLTSPVQGLARTATRDVEIDGVTIPEGKKVLLLYASANRDERAFGPTAEKLDVDRAPGQILTFSHGAHFCLGAAAARLMGRVALEEILAACPDYAVDTAAGRFAPGHFVRWYESLPFHPGPRP